MMKVNNNHIRISLILAKISHHRPSWKLNMLDFERKEGLVYDDKLITEGPTIMPRESGELLLTTRICRGMPECWNSGAYGCFVLWQLPSKMSLMSTLGEGRGMLITFVWNSVLKLYMMSLQSVVQSCKYRIVNKTYLRKVKFWMVWMDDWVTPRWY